MENNSTPITHVNSVYGKIDFKVGPDGSLILSQRNTLGANNCIILNPIEAEKLAKALFKKKQELMPSANPQKAQTKSKVQQQTTAAQSKGTAPSYMEQQKAEHPNAYSKWTEAEDNILKKYCQEGKSVDEIAGLLKRNAGAITSRMKKLGIVKND